MHKGHIAVVAMVALLFFAGCSSGEEQTSTEGTNEEEVSAELKEFGPPQVQADNAETEFNATITPTPGLTERQALPLQRYEADGDQLTLFFEMESQSCFGLEVEYTESDTAVEVALWTGRLPEVDADDCGIGIYSYNTVIDLDDELGERDVIAAVAATPSPSGNPTSGPVGGNPSQPEDEELEVELDDDGRADPEQFVGLEIDEAVDLADGNDVVWHVAKINGEPTVAAAPSGRHVIFELEDDIVVSAENS